MGVTAGVPAPPYSRNDGNGCLYQNQTECGPNRFSFRPYTVGPSVELNLADPVAVEAGILFQRYRQQVTRGITAPHGGTVNFGQRYTVTGNGWLFPLSLKYIFRREGIAPFAAAGAVLRHLGPLKGQGVQLDFFLKPQPAAFRIESGRDLDVAIMAGVGAKWSTSRIQIAPEVRWLRWTSLHFQPVRNQVMLLVRFGFRAQSRQYRRR